MQISRVKASIVVQLVFLMLVLVFVAMMLRVVLARYVQRVQKEDFKITNLFYPSGVLSFVLVGLLYRRCYLISSDTKDADCLDADLSCAAVTAYRYTRAFVFLKGHSPSIRGVP